MQAVTKLTLNFLIAILIASATADGLNVTDPPTSCRPLWARQDCGYIGIQQPQCEALGCCWNPADYVPWCFYKSPDAPKCNPAKSRSDCGYGGITEQQCTYKGCCWFPSSQQGLPWCFYSNGIVPGYSVSSMSQGPSGYKGFLSLTDGSNMYGADITPLAVDVQFQTADRLRVRIFDPSNPRWEVPQSQLPTEAKESRVSPADANYAFSWTSSPFGFQVTRKSDGMVIWNSTANYLFNGLVFEDQYLEISTALPQQPNVYGLGEHVRRLKLDADGSLYTMWNRDSPSPVNENIYGAHPFYLEMRGTQAHGVFLKSSNGMDVQVNPGWLTFKTIGGIIDLYFFVGPSPDAVIQQYHNLIGTPHMPPLWSLGFHHCRYGYRNIDEVINTVNGYRAANIPIDAIWTDIDYMDGFRDFSFDPVNFPVPRMQGYLNQLHGMGMKYVLIVDPAIKVDPGYPAWDSGSQQNVFIKDKNDRVFTGKVWPGITAFPDFFHPNTQGWWKQNIDDWRRMVAVDGLWIDMNEPSNFCQGECSQALADEPEVAPSQPSKLGDVNNPPYRLNTCGNRCALNTATLDMDAKHYGGARHYDAHNLYGHSEGIATKVAFEASIGQRSLVISRSTFPGSGHHVGHWLGDNFATWEDLAYSIPGQLAMNMFGIPLVGADICGFLGATTEELCGRWIQVGAWSTFSRNHHTIDSPEQPLYKWDSVANISRTVLGARYSLIPYYNTLFYYANKNGGMVQKPLFFEWPDQITTLSIERQFLVGRCILVSPVVYAGANTVSAYIPLNTRWYSLWDLSEQTQNGWRTLNAPFQFVPVHVRGGCILPMQVPAINTVGMTNNAYRLLVALDGQGSASGSLFLDDGVTLNVGDPSTMTLLRFSAANQVVNATVDVNGFSGAATLNFDQFRVAGIANAPSRVNLNGSPVPSSQVNYAGGVLTVNNLSVPVSRAFSFSWS